MANKFYAYVHASGPATGATTAQGMFVYAVSDYEQLMAFARKFTAHQHNCNLARPCSCGFDEQAFACGVFPAKPDSEPPSRIEFYDPRAGAGGDGE
jgi:hypothetical protein